MAELKDYGIGALTISLLISLGFAVMPDDTHVCRDLEITKYCDRLSSTELTCYPAPAVRVGSKYCSSGWEEIGQGFTAIPQSYGPGITRWDCSTTAPCELIE